MRKSLKGKDGIIVRVAHSLDVVGSNPTTATETSFFFR